MHEAKAGAPGFRLREAYGDGRLLGSLPVKDTDELAMPEDLTCYALSSPFTQAALEPQFRVWEAAFPRARYWSKCCSVLTDPHSNLTRGPSHLTLKESVTQRVSGRART